MNPKAVRLIIAAVVFAGLAFGLGSVLKDRPSQEKPAVSTAGLWLKVQEAEKAGLPQTAIGHLKEIYGLAVEGQRDGEALRALTRILVLEAAIEGNLPAARVSLLREEIAKAPAGLQPMLRTVLARWFWQYYSRNKWRFLQRDATAGGLDEKDFTTWDLPRIFREIDTLFQDVLKDAAILKRTPLSVYRDFLEPGNQPAAYRPTLFDFLAFEATAFYTSGEQAGARPEDAFEIEAESPALAAAAEFVRWSPETSDADSPALKALSIFRDLLVFHRGDAEPEAFLDADLLRLRWIRSVAAGETASERFRKRLEEIALDYRSSPLSSRAYFLWADELFDLGDWAEAKNLAERGRRAHPDSSGAADCSALIDRITAREFTIRTESVVPPGAPSRMAVDHRNVETLHFRAIREDFDELLKGESAYSVIWADESDIRRYLQRTPDAVWTARLPATSDFKTRTTPVDVPSLAPGFYRILAGVDRGFAETKNRIEAGSLWVSDLGLLTGALGSEVEGVIVRNASGEPVPDVESTLYDWDYRSRAFVKTSTVRTDALGAFSLRPSEDHGNRVLVLRENGAAKLSETNVWSGSPHREAAFQRTIVFTDRSIYRPGQTIRFKALCLQADASRTDYRVLPKQSLRIVFRDVNSREIETLDLMTNAFGSASGVFTAPAAGLTGLMTISADHPDGSCSVRVEEYKRPKFRVVVSVPDREFRLGDIVEVPGEAMSYAGAPIDGALVTYRVAREARFPRWWWFGDDVPNRSAAREIAHGTLRTDEKGAFVILFPARPDPAVPISSRPVFAYTVTAEVTDGTGETRAARGVVRVGAAALEAAISGADWQERGQPVVLDITTSTVNGKPAPAEGTIEIFALKGPDRPVPTDLIGADRRRGATGSPDAYSSGTPDWRRWPDGRSAARKDFTSNEQGRAALSFDLEAGAYRAVLLTRDRYGEPVEGRWEFLVLDPSASTAPVKVPFLAAAKSSSVEVGGMFELLWTTGYDRGPVLVEVLHGGRRIRRSWIGAETTQSLLRFPVEEVHRGGFTVIVTLVKDNRLYREVRRVHVPWSNKRLDLTWKTFRSKLRPGQEETWSLEIRGSGAEAAAAEMVASLYDASLDAFAGHGFPGLYGIFKSEPGYPPAGYSNRGVVLRAYQSGLNVLSNFTSLSYPRFPDDVERAFFGYDYPSVRKAMMPAAADEARSLGEAQAVPEAMAAGAIGDKGGPGEEAGPEVDLSTVPARRNLEETAFFFPDLVSDAAGVVTIAFKMPEALTEWRFLGFAHTPDLKSGSIEGRTVTQKELMVQPNPPRFLRQGDAFEFAVKVTNMTEDPVEGAVELRFFDPVSDRPLDEILANRTPKIAFEIPAKGSRSFSWAIAVPDGLETAGYRAVAAAGGFSDGEEGVVPVLSRRLLVRESLPLWISGRGVKTFDFRKLADSGSSPTLRHAGLTVQMASNPSWYAVQALPYLMEYPYECSEQVFNRLYANALARTIAGSDPRIRKVFDRWKGTPALESNLEKNQDLKSVRLEETPWVLEAMSESRAKRNIGLLFDENTMSFELGKAFGKLAEMQLPDGAWPWFPGGPGNDYITLYIVSGFGRLKNLGAGSVSWDPALRAVGRLDGWINRVYEEILRTGDPEDNHLSPTIALYLYARSFFREEQPVPGASRKAVDYFLAQSAKFWLELNNRQSQAHLALGLNRFGDVDTARAILRSFLERSRHDEELGRFWSETELSWWWYRAPIETQAMMIEAFEEVTGDAKTVEECKIWLLKQKQTRDWKTTKATADAVYALILRGTDLLASDEVVEVSLGGRPVKPESVEAGTGFYEKRFDPAAIDPSMGAIEIRKAGPGIAWGGVHWQYLEDVSRITPHEQNPLRLKKSVFVRRATKKGPLIEPVSGPVAVGDTLVVRIELRTDRDMEYIHMKDHRGSGLEPVNVLSRYRFQDGLAYYEATKDTATHFFIDYLPKGVYVFEYEMKVQHRGTYENGLAHIECMYAPEFNSHSESVRLEVR